MQLLGPLVAFIGLTVGTQARKSPSSRAAFVCSFTAVPPAPLEPRPKLPTPKPFTCEHNQPIKGVRPTNAFCCETAVIDHGHGPQRYLGTYNGTNGAAQIDQSGGPSYYEDW
jgi:hypothetical protein